MFILFFMIFSFLSFSSLCSQRTEKEVDSNAGKEEQMLEKMRSGAEKHVKNKWRGEQWYKEES